MRETLPDLRIMPTQSLLLGEQADSHRLNPIVEHLRTEGVLRDPPVVAAIGNDSSQYMVLDGIESVIALRKMKVPHILGQVVGPGNAVSPRALRVNYPLAELMNENSLAEKNNTLRQWLQARIVARGVRCYEEETILFDE